MRQNGSCGTRSGSGASGLTTHILRSLVSKSEYAEVLKFQDPFRNVGNLRGTFASTFWAVCLPVYLEHVVWPTKLRCVKSQRCVFMDFKRPYLNSSGNFSDLTAGRIWAQKQQPLVMFLVSCHTVRIVSFDSSTGCVECVCACDHINSLFAVPDTPWFPWMLVWLRKVGMMRSAQRIMTVTSLEFWFTLKT